MKYIILFDIVVNNKNKTLAACNENYVLDVIITSDRTEAEDRVREIKSLEPMVKNVRLCELTEVEI